MSDEPENGPDGKPDKEPARLSFSLPQLLGSAAAAMTVAYVGSSLGTAGTIFGAALASVIGAIAGTVYTAGLDRTGRQLGSVMQRGWTRIRRADPELDEGGGYEAEESPDATGGSPSGDVEPPPDKGRTWRRIALRVLTAAAAIFAVSFVAITGWELVTGSALGGGEGTTVGQVVRPERTPTAEPEPTPSEPTVSETPTPEPTETEPTPEPSESVTPEPSPTPSETVEPTPTPAVSQDPGASPAGQSEP
ncbi:MAG: hypothetical protein KIT69_16770 [Propionibacteriaceae bacterium]|nr:hypothetical protein [Propionibacteriaceae bacterium]